ncbi:hypothetical protein TNCV_2676991 [Trichonephila clavipes]|nr:hypothetical protein TNCV_2676991 [Trichonephila clavipes]
MVKVTDSWPACHEFELCVTENPPCRGGDARYFVEAQTSFRWCGAEIRRRVYPLRCRPRHLVMAQRMMFVTKSPRVAE